MSIYIVSVLPPLLNVLLSSDIHKITHAISAACHQPSVTNGVTKIRLLFQFLSVS